MKKVCGAGVLLALLLLSGGCRTGEAEPEDKSAPPAGGEPTYVLTRDAAQARETALKYGNSMIQALKDNDYEAFVQHLAPLVRDRVTPEHFADYRRRLEEKMGKMVKAEFLTELSQGAFTNYLWKVTFDKSVKRVNGELETQQVEWLYHLIVGYSDGKYVVMNFGF